ncbi:MAG TPA: cytochrome c biogenesis protein CcdA [Methanoculleus sp.]|nr:cytochrome c biogenesis protein CcdA [Methanoculleus sp.]
MNNIWILAVIVGLVCLVPSGAAAPESPVCTWYFTAVGCSNCADIDPLVLGDWLETYPDLVVIEYELYEHAGNAPVYDRFIGQYNLEYGIPLFFISPDSALRGVRQITREGPTVLNGIDGEVGVLHLASLRIAELEGSPKIWCRDRILIRSGAGGDDALLRQVLVADDVGVALEGHVVAPCEPDVVKRSGSGVAFDHAVRVEGWIVQWRGAPLRDPVSPVLSAPSGESRMMNGTAPPHTLPKIVALAFVDAVNPCALAVLALVLMSVMASSAGSPRRVLWAGIAFSAAIFIMYFIYGLVIVSLFSLAAEVAGMRQTAGLILGSFAILLGAAQLYDARVAGTGKSVTGMPEGFRSTVSRLVASISSVPGAFLIGMLVTVFLLPCTIGPYIIAGGVLSPMGLIATLPYLLLYNAIFILPMLAITAAAGLGLGRTERFSAWRKKHLRAIHALSGVIMLVFGFGLVTGLF